ncbi:hypothetical protein ACFYXS_14550 [Streptomyces sp. NPDC002574]|uniref:hypothetical protein n=1 Tax=Streptomyces sp. NPDC002574 TaxID=3364652 RepID=UPI0036BAE5D9
MRRVPGIPGVPRAPSATDAGGPRRAHTSDAGGRRGTYTLPVPLGRVEKSFCIRLRGNDGRRNGPGPPGAGLDPHGPLAHTPGDGDPWVDTWCCTDPIFVDVTR